MLTERQGRTHTIQHNTEGTKESMCVVSSQCDRKISTRTHTLSLHPTADSQHTTHKPHTTAAPKRHPSLSPRRPETHRRVGQTWHSQHIIERRTSVHPCVCVGVCGCGCVCVHSLARPSVGISVTARPAIDGMNDHTKGSSLLLSLVCVCVCLSAAR